MLEQLEAAALAANVDVQAAVACVDQSRAVLDDIGRDHYPTVTVASSVEVRATAAKAESDAALLDDVRVSVAAEVARNYLELRGLQQQVAVLERSLDNQRETLRLTQLRRDAGFGEEQDVASAAARVAAIESGMPLRSNVFARTDSRAWPVAPALSWAAFDLGSARARLHGAKAGTREMLAVDEQTVLQAIEETDNALALYREQQARLVRITEQAREHASGDHRARPLSRRRG